MRRARWLATAALVFTALLGFGPAFPASAEDGSVGITVAVPSSTPSPSPSVSESPSGGNGGGLPTTGLPLAMMVGGAIALIVVGAAAVAVGRRQRYIHPAGNPARQKGQYL